MSPNVQLHFVSLASEHTLMKTLQTIYEGKVVVSCDTPAVSVYHFLEQAFEFGAVSEHEINPGMMEPLANFGIGDEVFFQSPDAMDCLDDSDDFAAQGSRQWFLGTIIAQSTDDRRCPR